MNAKDSGEFESGSLEDYSKTFNISDTSNSDHVVSSPPVFLRSNPHAITNESITVLEDSSLEEHDGKAGKYKIQGGNIVIQSQVRSARAFKKIFAELRDPGAERPKEEATLTIVLQPALSIEKIRKTLCVESLKTISKEIVVVEKAAAEVETDRIDKADQIVQAEVSTTIKATQTDNTDEKMIQKMKAEIEIQCRNIGNYQREKQTLSKTIQKAQSDYTKLKNESEAKRKTLIVENDKLKRELEKVQESSALMNIQLCEEKMKGLSLTGTSKSLANEVDKLKKEINVRNSEHGTVVAALNEKLKIAQDQTKGLPEEISKLRQDLEKLNEKYINECNAGLSHKTESQKREVELATLLKKNEEIIATMKAEFTALTKSKEETISGMKIEMENMSRKLNVEKTCTEVQTEPWQRFTGEVRSQFEQMLSQRRDNRQSSCAAFLAVNLLISESFDRCQAPLQFQTAKR